MKTVDYLLGAGPHAATRVEHDDGTVMIRTLVSDGEIVGHGNTAREAAVHLAEQLRALAHFIEGHEGLPAQGLK